MSKNDFLRDFLTTKFEELDKRLDRIESVAQEGVRANLRLDKHESWAAGAFAVVSTIAAGAGFAANYILRKFGLA